MVLFAFTWLETIADAANPISSCAINPIALRSLRSQRRFEPRPGGASGSRPSELLWKGMAPQPKEDAEVTALNELTGLTTERPIHTFALQVMSGPDASKSFVIDSNREGRVLIGQSPACGVRLVDPTVSRRHVALELACRHVDSSRK